ncbi:MAG: hypothetical protein IKU14_00135, partial [Rhodocyclaceae bacterium]|nr:hypothetical protein [Rhodocyclaceae bacterium]
SQIDGLPPLQAKEITWNPSERASAILKASGVRIEHVVGDQAFYRPATDTITLPDPAQFPTADDYYGTVMHELGHATGHESRLNRPIHNPFGSVEYAREEMRAEIASMILGDEFGLGHDPANHAAYVGHWIKILKDDPSELYRACADAEKIFHYVMALEQQQELSQDQAQTQEQVQPVEQEQVQAQQQATQPEQSADEVRLRGLHMMYDQFGENGYWVESEPDQEPEVWRVEARSAGEDWRTVAEIEHTEKAQAKALAARMSGRPYISDADEQVAEKLREYRLNPDGRDHLIAGDIPEWWDIKPEAWTGVDVVAAVGNSDDDYDIPRYWEAADGVEPDAWCVQIGAEGVLPDGEINPEVNRGAFKDRAEAEAMAHRTRVIDAYATLDPQQQAEKFARLAGQNQTQEQTSMAARKKDEKAERIYLGDVPFTNNKQVKDAGGRWDGKENAWYVPAGVDPKPFKKWQEEVYIEAGDEQQPTQQQQQQPARGLRKFTRRQKEGSSTVSYVANERAQNRFARADFRDYGARIDVRNWRDEAVTLAALQLAAQKWGAVKLTGSEKYREMATRLADEHGIPVLNAVRTEGMNQPKAEERTQEATAQQTPQPQPQPSEEQETQAEAKAEAVADIEREPAKAVTQAANIATEDTRLYVSFDEKDIAKKRGAKWHKAGKYWFAPKGSDLNKFAQWRDPKNVENET